MANLTDGLTDHDWDDARAWVDKLEKDPQNEDLLIEFENWLGEAPARAGAYRKILDTLALLPLLKASADNQDEDCPGLKRPPE